MSITVFDIKISGFAQALELIFVAYYHQSIKSKEARSSTSKSWGARSSVLPFHCIPGYFVSTGRTLGENMSKYQTPTQFQFWSYKTTLTYLK